MKTAKNQQLTTFDQLMQDPKQREKFDKEYSKFLLKEFLLEAMDKNKMSVRKLSEKSGVSTSIIQNIRSEKSSNITINTLNSLMATLGYRMNFEKIGNMKSKVGIK
jgi:DNA-binding Xre family transcriptional regulator